MITHIKKDGNTFHNNGIKVIILERITSLLNPVKGSEGRLDETI